MGLSCVLVVWLSFILFNIYSVIYYITQSVELHS